MTEQGGDRTNGTERLAALVTAAAEDSAADWDAAGEIPLDILRHLGRHGVLCAETAASPYGGAGLRGLDNGALTAHTGTLCSSLRTVMTSQGMAAWTVSRFGTAEQRREYLPALVDGYLAAVAFSEPDAGSDLSRMRTTIRRKGTDGADVVLDGEKSWISAATYADYVVVVARVGDEDRAVPVIVPATARGVQVVPVGSPLGCRAAGHAALRFDSVTLPADAVLGDGLALQMLVTIALTYGRLSVAWGCVGILRACLAATTAHARGREQFGQPLARHQLVARHLAELFVAERTATQVCEYASRAWDERSTEHMSHAILAKHVASGHAARGAAAAVQIHGSAGAHDHHVVARAYRDAKLMELIEGSSEICQLVLADQAMAVWS